MQWSGLILSASLIFHLSCTKTKTISPSPGGSSNVTNGWLIPTNQVFDGGPGKDGIPSIDNPNFTTTTEVDFLQSDDLVLIMKTEGDIKAYPHPILDWHEIVNDEISTEKYSITYCPLTGTGIAWDRVIQGTETTFGVSGLLYNTNLMPYDRHTGSTWSQQRLDCVNGQLVGSRVQTLTLVETTFETFLTSYPKGKVLNLETGFDRSYGDYPYGDYRQNDAKLLFPVTTKDNRLPLKTRTLGVLLGASGRKVYTFGKGEAEIELHRDNLGEKDLVIIRSIPRNFIVAFEDDGLELTLVADRFPIVLKDKNAVTYDFLGAVMEGPVDVSPLHLPTQFIGYWFSWGAFYPAIEISDW